MITSGNPETSLYKKLGIKPGLKIQVINAPVNYAEMLPVEIADQYISPGQIPELVHLFAANHAEFKKEMKGVLRLVKKNRSITVWVSWYKRSAAKTTDLSENIIRDFALQHGLVDVKVCAVSEEWSGLKLVVPLAKR